MGYPYYVIYCILVYTFMHFPSFILLSLFLSPKAKERARSNRITSLMREDGVTVTEQAELKDVAKAFYTNLFTAQDVLELEGILQHVPVKVTDEMKASMNMPFTEKEVERALFMMGASKAPRSD